MMQRSPFLVLSDKQSFDSLNFISWKSCWPLKTSMAALWNFLRSYRPNSYERYPVEITPDISPSTCWFIDHTLGILHLQPSFTFKDFLGWTCKRWISELSMEIPKNARYLLANDELVFPLRVAGLEFCFKVGQMGVLSACYSFTIFSMWLLCAQFGSCYDWSNQQKSELCHSLEGTSCKLEMLQPWGRGGGRRAGESLSALAQRLVICIP